MKSAKLIRVIAVTAVVAMCALNAAAQQGSIRAGGTSVALIARTAAVATVTGSVVDVPRDSMPTGQTGEMIVLQQAWAAEPGQTVTAECEVLTEPGTSAQLFLSREQYISANSSSMGPDQNSRQMQKYSLTPDPALPKSSSKDSQILLVVHYPGGKRPSSGDPAAAVRINVVAF